MTIEFTEKEMTALKLYFEDAVLSKKKILEKKQLMNLISAVDKITEEK